MRGSEESSDAKETPKYDLSGLNDETSEREDVISMPTPDEEEGATTPTAVTVPQHQEELQPPLVARQPPVPAPRRDVDRIVTGRSAAVVDAAENAQVRSSDSVLSSETTSTVGDDEDDDDDDDAFGATDEHPNNGNHGHASANGSVMQQSRRTGTKKPRASSLQYMQEASVEVNLLEGSSLELVPDTDDENDGDAKLGSSWSEVFHESHVGAFQSSSSLLLPSTNPSPATQTRQPVRRTSSAASSSRLRRSASRESVLPSKVPPRQVVERHGILRDSSTGDSGSAGESDEPRLLYELLSGLASSYRHDLSQLKTTILVSYPGASFSGPGANAVSVPASSTNKSSEVSRDGDGSIAIRFLTAGYPAQPALLQCPDRFASTFVGCLVSILIHGDGLANEDSLGGALDSRTLYASARFQGHPDFDSATLPRRTDKPALAVAWDLWQRSIASTSHDSTSTLSEMLGRLAVVLGMAGVTPRILRDMLRVAGGSGGASAADRWAIIRALSHITDGASGRTTGPLTLYGDGPEDGPTSTSDCSTDPPPSRPRSRTFSDSNDDVIAMASSSRSPSVGQTFVPEHFFVWTGRPEGWTRKISGLSAWPFRNDFAVSLWFRADHLDPSRYPVLLSYRAETAVSGSGGGVDVSLVPLGRGTGTQACTIQVSVYDYDKHVPAHTLHVPGCVLLSNVWYHIAVRHSSARLKGVFSLTSRQQVTVFVNGNVVLQQPLPFPKISAADTIQGESALLPAMVRAAAAAAAARRPSGAGGGGMYSCIWTLCADFDGQTTSFVVFNDHVSDATFRALFLASGGSDASHIGGGGASISKLSRSFSADRDRWDSRKSEVARKTRALDDHLMNDDADEVVLSQRRSAILAWQRRNAAAMDLGGASASATENDETNSTSHHSQLGGSLNTNGDLLKPAVFGTKVFLVWDPRRTVGDLAVELHQGAHLKLCHDAFRWSIASPQEVISSLGGVQVLILLFRSMLEGDSDFSYGVPYLLSLLSSFVRNHDDNARELLRCGGIDVIEYLISKASSKLLKPIHTQREASRMLVAALVGLRSASGHYLGLETKVFSRLVVNLPLWLGTIYGEHLQDHLMPVLSAVTKAHPDKVRDCVGVRDIIQVLLCHRPNDLDESGNERLALLSDMLLGMIFEILSSGVTPHDFSPFLCGLTFNLEALANSVNLAWHHRLTTKLCAVLLFLLQVRPQIPGLYESFASCCGSAQAAVGWILCSVVKASDDQIRSIGIRCAAEYLDVASKGADVPLTLGLHSVLNSDPVDSGVSGEIPTSVSRFGRIAKGFVVMAPASKASILSPTKQTPRVAVKLLWHLLKSNREDLEEATNSALIYWISDDGGTISASLSSLDFVRDHLITKSSTLQPCWRLDMDWATSVFAESGSIVGRSLKSPLALAAIVRLLKYLNAGAQDRWLGDLLTLARSNRKSTSLLSSVTDWQPCLFHLASETLEALRSTAVRQSEGFLGTSNYSDSSSSWASAIGRRLELCLDLYSTLLGHLVREGGDKSLDAIEQAVSLQRVCLNGHDVVFLILSALCENLFDHGTIPDREIGAIAAEDFKDVDFDNDSLPLKQSARLVTDAILSNGAKGLDMPTAVKSWRSLRHLTAVIVALCSGSRFGVVDLFDYNHHQAASVDVASGGLHGVRLADGRLARISHSLYLAFIDAAARNVGGHDDSSFRRDMDRRFCTHLAAQILALLDAFIFPESLDEALPSSQLHSLALVRHSEPRLGVSQGPLVASAMRLSAVLIALLEPGSVKLLQCASRTRCLVSWALEMEREWVAADAKAKQTDNLDDVLNRLFVATLMHCHRALGRCSSLLSEIDSSSFEKYFDSRESHKKHHRRLLRTALEMRDVVSSIFRGCKDVLVLSLSDEAFEALRCSLEGTPQHRVSKESVAMEFLGSYWVTGFSDVEIRRECAIPEQLSMGTVPVGSDEDFRSDGFTQIEKLALETRSIAADLEKTLDGCFEEYLEATRLWAETDAVRDLEFEGDSTVKRLAEKYKSDYGDVSRALMLKRPTADNRMRRIFRMAGDPWEIVDHWTLGSYTDRNGRRTLMVPNRRFSDHQNASYELMMEKEREKAERERRARLGENQMTEVMRRNAEAFALHDSFVVDDADNKDDDSSTQLVSDGEASDVGSCSGAVSVDSSKQPDPAGDEEWDRIETDEYSHVNAEGDVDAWARLFIWSDGEAVVARFDAVMIVTTQSSVDGKLLLTTHGLYIQQTGIETSVITKSPLESQDSMVADSKHRRWRLTRLLEVHGRRFLLRHQALELFFSDGQQLFLNFPGGPRERDRFYAKLRNSCKVPMLGSLKSLNPRTIFRKTRLSELWQKRKISNFEYLMALNRMAGRSFNDVTQYPVFPWILADYTSETIDLSDSRVYRDLSKPIGALNADRLAQLLERYKDLELFGFSEAEKFLYGSHYSSPGIVLHYLIRQEPFTTMAIELQSGRFDCPDRLFFDIAGSWNGCLSSSSDMKELIPEFFCLPEMFLNTNDLPLGRTQGGRSVDNVGLPPWAKGSAHEFVRIHRLALESEYVSQNLHGWIDLIFGYKQRGPEAEAAHNLFHHLSYEGAVDLDKIADEVDRQAAESHIQNFGQTPSQLITTESHPCRLPAMECWRPLIYSLEVPRNLRCYTPSKQFGNKGSDLANGAVLKIHVLSETLIVIYADMSIGSYRWYPISKANRLRMDKLRPLPRRELCTSRSAIKRGSAIPQEKLEQYGFSVGNGSFAVSIGGQAKEELRRKALLPPSTRLMAGSETTLAGAELSGFLVSCGFWDDTIKVHSTETLRLLANESGGHRGPIRCVAEDEGLVVTGGEDATCRIWVLSHPDMAVALSDGYVQTALGASNDGDQLLSCCHVLWGHDTPITALALDSSLDAVASGSHSGLVCIHTIRRGEFIRSFRVPSASDSSRHCSAAVQKLAIVSNGNMVVHMQDFGLHAYTVNAVLLSSVNAGELLFDMCICSLGEILVTGGMNCQVVIRSVHDLQVLSMLDLTRHGPVRCIGMTPDDLNPTKQFLFIGSEDGMITIIDEDQTASKGTTSLF